MTPCQGENHRSNDLSSIDSAWVRNPIGDWIGTVIRGKFNLKINRSVETPLHEHSRVVGSGSWVPGGFKSKNFSFLSRAIGEHEFEFLNAYILPYPVELIILPLNNWVLEGMRPVLFKFHR